MSLQSIDIVGFKSGVQKNKKPCLLMDDAFVDLRNAYCWREEIKKRQGLQFIGRYRRALTGVTTRQSDGAAITYDPPATGSQTIDIFSLYSPSGTEPNPELEPGSLVFTLDSGGANETILTDNNSNGILDITGAGPIITIAWVNYATGVITANFSSDPGSLNVTLTMNYYPSLPAMGIPLREISGINSEETLWFDTKYCYKHDGSDFNEFLPAENATWNGQDYDFFWGTNYRGSDSYDRLFFVTNFVQSTGSPMRYTDGTNWFTFSPGISGATSTTADTNFLYSARILLPYYGRLIALNTLEGTTVAASQNIYNRCRFSQIGNPVQATVVGPPFEAGAWRSDVFGKGGFVDAPTNEAIVSARFYKNTLIVAFERSTWRLQYLGEYGLPFIWERISSDFGSESTFSTVLFDNGVLMVGDKAIVGSSGSDVQRIDLDIPDLVYSFKNEENGTKRVHGIRDFKNELVFWCYPEYADQQLPTQYFPNHSLVYNYRNNTYAFFRNNVTCFGNFQYPQGVSWDSLDVFWDYPVSWDNPFQPDFPMIVSGNQQGFAHFYGYPDVETGADSTISALDQESLSVTNVTVGSTVVIEVINHNLMNGEIIYLVGMIFVVDDDPPTEGSTTLNDQIYAVSVSDNDKDNLTLFKWDPDQQEYVNDFDVTNVGEYAGNGRIALFPKMRIETKDFNPAKQAGFNIKTSYIDFLFDASSPSPINVIMMMNTTLNAKGNNQTNGQLLIGNSNVETANSKTGYITNITQTASPTVVVKSNNHGLLTGDQIFFSDIQGSTELNGNTYSVTFLSTNTFSVQEASISAYTGGGYWEQNLQQYFTLSAEYAWHRFFCNSFGQFLRLILTYNDDQMNQLSTHQQNFVLNAMKIWYRPGGRNIFGK